MDILTINALLHPSSLRIKLTVAFEDPIQRQTPMTS
jgi:hypothetical protein